MGTLCKPFYYDVVISVSANKNQYEVFSGFKKQLAGKKFLGATFNHRTFTIHEKNYIKALIDHFNFDHLMLSLRPSAQLMLLQTPSVDLEEFRELSQVIFVLQTMARYEIANGLVSDQYLGIGAENCAASIVVGKLKEYLKEFEKKLILAHPEKNIKKIFCSLTSLELLEEKLRNC